MCVCVAAETLRDTHINIIIKLIHRPLIFKRVPIILKVSMSKIRRVTFDRDLSGPFGGSVQHGLFNSLHLLSVVQLSDNEDGANGFKDLRLVPLTYLHAVFHGGDDVLVSVLCTCFTALLRCP